MLGAILLQACTCAAPKDTIKIDGSSTIYVISEAIAEEYKKQQQGKVSISISGTGGGFKKLCSKRIDIIGASRPITSSEKELCKLNKVEYLELPIAYDGIVLVVNKANAWIDEIKVSALKRIFEPEAEGKINHWSDINPSWPRRKFEIFAPGISSGTYDYFTKAVVGKEHSSRGDITTSEDDNVLVHGVSSTIDGLGFFSFAYFLENQNELKALAIIDDTSDKKKTRAVLPTKQTIITGEYSPLSRPVYLYVNKDINEKSKDFLKFYLDHSQKIAQDVGFVPLNPQTHKKANAILKGIER